MKVVIIQSANLSHVLLTENDGTILFRADVAHSDVELLIEQSESLPLTKDLESEFDTIAYSKPYEVYVYTGEIHKAIATKKAPAIKKAPAKKSATGKKK